MVNTNINNTFEDLCLLSLLLITTLFFTTDLFAAGTVGNGTPGSCTDATLTKALAGGGNVTFKCGSRPVTITFGSEKTISANTTIDGGNLITLSGGNSKRLFSVKDFKSFTVKNITLANGYTAGQGAAITGGWQTIISANRCSFLNNTSTQLGEAGGGAIFGLTSTINIENSKFSGNKASLGGAIRNLNSNLTVKSSTFSGNKAVDRNIGNGGAIYIDGARGDNGQIVIQNSSFTSNSATSYGGAILNSIYNNNKTTISNSQFVTNAVGGGSNGQGGAIWSTGDPASGGHWIVNTNNTTLNITNTTIAGNIAGTQGGGLWIARHPKGAVISNSTINGNRTQSSMGGGIVQGGNGKLSVINSTITDNRVSGTYAMGGAVYVNGSGMASFTNATIANNTANWQAGGIFGASNVTLKNTILANNIALNGGNTWNIKHNCFQPMTNGGNNIQFPKPTDAPCTSGIMIADPKLVAVKNNSGPTLTRALSSGSAASRKGSGCPAVDQRGIARPKPAGTSCDIGAYEAAL